MGLLRRIQASIGAKVAILIAAALVIITVFFSYYHYREGTRLLFRGVEMRLLHISQGLEWRIEGRLARSDREGLHLIVMDEAQGSDAELIIVIDPQGTVIEVSKNKWRDRHITEMRSAELTDRDMAAIRKAMKGDYSLYYEMDDAQYHLVSPLSFGTAGKGALFISLDLGAYSAALKKSVLQTSAALLVAAVLLGAGIYYTVYYLFTGRIERVSSSAVRLASGNVHARADVGGTDEVGYLASSFNLLAEEITNWRSNLEEMVSFRTKELSTLYNVAEAISQSLELSRVLPNVLDCILDALGEQKGVIVLVNSEGNAFTVAAHRGFAPETVQALSRLRVGDGLVGETIAQNRAVRTANVDDADVLKDMPWLEYEGVRSTLAVPISVRGSALGAIAVFSGRKGRYTDENEFVLTTIGNQTGVAVENARLYERFMELAHEDELTGLANRRSLMQVLVKEVNRSGRYTTPLSVLMLDLDGFKQFNDAHGHLKGDDLLRSFAGLVQESIRTTDTAGRYGGEEFVVILPNTPLQGALVTAERIRKAMEELRVPLAVGGAGIGTTVSIGAAELQQGGIEADLLHSADSALYRAKQEGRNRVAW